jgi:peroxiredoxin
MITLIIMAVALIGGTLSCSSSSSPSEAPDFTLPTLTGANITLSELRGVPVVLVFWTTWCPHCPTELHHLEDVAKQKEGEIKVVAINVGESASKVQTFFGGYEPTMIVALDEDTQVFVNYCQKYENPGKIPFTLFVDSEGIIQYVQIGAFSSEAALWDKLSSVLGITAP